MTTEPLRSLTTAQVAAIAKDRATLRKMMIAPVPRLPGGARSRAFVLAVCTSATRDALNGWYYPGYVNHGVFEGGTGVTVYLDCSDMLTEGEERVGIFLGDYHAGLPLIYVPAVAKDAPVDAPFPATLTYWAGGDKYGFRRRSYVYSGSWAWADGDLQSAGVRFSLTRLVAGDGSNKSRYKVTCAGADAGTISIDVTDDVPTTTNATGITPTLGNLLTQINAVSSVTWSSISSATIGDTYTEVIEADLVGANVLTDAGNSLSTSLGETPAHNLNGGILRTPLIVALQRYTGGTLRSGLVQLKTGSGLTIDTATVTSGGSGYTSAPTVSLTPGPAGAGALAASLVAVLSSSVTALSLVTGGAGYSVAPTVSFSGGGGSGATATATVAGNVTGATITNTGSGYTSAPTIAFTSGGGTGAAATAILSATGKVAAIKITTAGSGYTSAPTMGFTGGGGTGAAATAELTGAVTAVTLGSGGTGYTSAPTITLEGGGVGATAVVSGMAGTVDSITVRVAGGGYTTTPTVSFTGGGGSGATATVTTAADGRKAKWLYWLYVAPVQLPAFTASGVVSFVADAVDYGPYSTTGAGEELDALLADLSGWTFTGSTHGAGAYGTEFTTIIEAPDTLTHTLSADFTLARGSEQYWIVGIAPTQGYGAVGDLDPAQIDGYLPGLPLEVRVDTADEDKAKLADATDAD